MTKLNGSLGYIVAFRVDQPNANGLLEAHVWNGRNFHDTMATIQRRAAASIPDPVVARRAAWAYPDTIRVVQCPMPAAFGIALHLAPDWCLHMDSNGRHRQSNVPNQFFADVFVGTVYLTGPRSGSDIYRTLSADDVRAIRRATGNDLTVYAGADDVTPVTPRDHVKASTTPTRAQRKTMRRSS